MKNRNTLQRRLVLETVRRMRNHPTAEEIYLAIAAENPLISNCLSESQVALGTGRKLADSHSRRSGSIRFSCCTTLPHQVSGL